MDLKLNNRLFLVGGVTSGFGKAICEKLIAEGGNVIGLARTERPLLDLRDKYGKQFRPIVGDITLNEVHELILEEISDQYLSGVVINAGGPPAGGFFDCEMQSWDDAYLKVLRWKISLVQKLMPIFNRQNYGRMVFIESVSIKQPVDNLILSNSLRAAVAGMVKTLSKEVAEKGITLNIMAPGYHLTPAMERLIVKRSEVDKQDAEVVTGKFTEEIPMKRMGSLDQFASLAVWLLSEDSGYLTGQTFSVDGGLIKGIFG